MTVKADSCLLTADSIITAHKVYVSEHLNFYPFPKMATLKYLGIGTAIENKLVDEVETIIIDLF